MMWEEVPAPRFATKRNPLRKTYGPEIGKVAELLGLTRLEHQQYIWDVLGEVQSEEAGDPNPGWWAYRTATITMPRRSGKTTLLQPMAMHRAEITQNGRLVMTAQTRIAAVKRWGDLADVIMSSYVGSRVKRKSSVGGERLTWIRSGSTFEPQPPIATAGHGDEPDLALATEIWSWSALQGAEIRAGDLPHIPHK
jgi:phage terminase large subunit-like protein